MEGSGFFFRVRDPSLCLYSPQRLRALRQQRVLTLRELEERSGVAYNTIWHLENGKRGAQPRTIRKLADALGVAPEALVKVEGSDA
jgi:transcriptional regulator with XRE-family HTH domain